MRSRAFADARAAAASFMFCFCLLPLRLFCRHVFLTVHHSGALIEVRFVVCFFRRALPTFSVSFVAAHFSINDCLYFEVCATRLGVSSKIKSPTLKHELKKRE